MEIEQEDEKSNDSFQAEMDLVKLEEEENTTTQKERLDKIIAKLNALKEQNSEESEQNKPEETPQVLRSGNPNVLRAGAPKKNTAQNEVPEPFDPKFKLNERYFFQNININEWNDITNFIEKFISEENLGEKDLEEFFDSHPKISKGNILKLQGSVGEIFSKKKDIKKYKILTNFLIKRYYKPKPVICECYFFPNPKNEQRVVNMFRTCKKTLDIAIFTFTRDSIAQAILEAQQRGVKVRCIGDDGNSKVKGSDVRLLASVGIPCKTDNNFRFHMHNKMAILDNSVVITGSFNWTTQAVNKNQDNILFIEDKNIANQYTEYYNKLWDSFDTVITKEEAKKYIEDEKKEQEKAKAEKAATAKEKTEPKKETDKKETDIKETDKKETAKKETAKKETDKKETTKKETVKKETTKKEAAKKETDKKQTAKKETTKKETTKKDTTKKETTKKETDKKETTKKETTKKATTKKETTKKETTKKEKDNTSKEKKTKKEKATKKETTTSSKGKSKSKTKETRPKTMKEVKKSSSNKSKEKKTKNTKSKSVEKQKTTKEIKKEKVEK